MYTMQKGLLDVVIDDAGQAWPAHSMQLRIRMHCVNYPGDFLTDMVGSLGFIVIARRARRRIIRINRLVASPAALVETLVRVCREPFSTVEFVDEGDTPPLTRVVLSLADAISFLSALVDARSAGRSMTLRPVGSSNDPAVTSLRILWADKGQGTHSDKMIEHLGSTGNFRHAVLMFDSEHGMSFRTIGSGMMVPSLNWAQSAASMPLRAQPDKIYWNWVASAIEAIYDCPEPQFFAVEADIYWPNFGWVRREYFRSTFPIRGPEEQPLLLTVTTK